MSGQTRTILYRTADIILAVLAAGCSVLFAWLRGDGSPEVWEYLAMVFGLLGAVVLPVLIHELGHLLFGLCAGMLPVSATFFFLQFGEGVRVVHPDFSGAVEFLPAGGRGMRARLISATAGGALLDFVFGTLLTVLTFVLPYHAMLLFTALLAPFVLYEGIRALLPADLPTGKTDGAVLMGLFLRRPEEDILARVYSAEGILRKGTFADISEEFLFETPVVREDLPAFRALLLLRMQYRIAEGREREAQDILSRLLRIARESGEEDGEAQRYRGYFAGSFSPEETPLGGVRLLEEAMCEKAKNSAKGRI